MVKTLAMNHIKIRSKKISITIAIAIAIVFKHQAKTNVFITNGKREW